jgi:hypothetical protein
MSSNIKNKSEPTTKEKLKQKLKEKRLGRTARFVRDNRLEKLEDKLNKPSISEEEKKKVQDEIDVLETIEEKEENFAGEYPEYGDSSCYGGTMEHND